MKCHLKWMVFDYMSFFFSFEDNTYFLIYLIFKWVNLQIHFFLIYWLRKTMSFFQVPTSNFQRHPFWIIYLLHLFLLISVTRTWRPYKFDFPNLAVNIRIHIYVSRIAFYNFFHNITRISCIRVLPIFRLMLTNFDSLIYV